MNGHESAKRGSNRLRTSRLPAVLSLGGITSTSAEANPPSLCTGCRPLCRRPLSNDPFSHHCTSVPGAGIDASVRAMIKMSLVTANLCASVSHCYNEVEAIDDHQIPLALPAGVTHARGPRPVGPSHALFAPMRLPLPTGSGVGDIFQRHPHDTSVASHTTAAGDRQRHG